jgi:hypothetical protein
MSSESEFESDFESVILYSANKFYYKCNNFNLFFNTVYNKNQLGIYTIFLNESQYRQHVKANTSDFHHSLLESSNCSNQSDKHKKLRLRTILEFNLLLQALCLLNISSVECKPSNLFVRNSVCNYTMVDQFSVIFNEISGTMTQDIMFPNVRSALMKISYSIYSK